MTTTPDLAAIIEPVARHLLGDPNAAMSTRTELRFGTFGSIAVRIGGHKRGTWYDHGARQGGGVLDLVRARKGVVGGEAVKWLAEQSFIPKRNQTAEPKVVATYDYHDANGKLLFQVVRKLAKTFRQRRPDGNGAWTWKLTGVARVPYRLPELLVAPATAPVFLAEGEEDVDALRSGNLVATCNPGGAGKPKSGSWSLR